MLKKTKIKASIVQILNLKKSYELKCFKCGYIGFTYPSSSMVSYQSNRGTGKCPKCKTKFILRIDEDNEKMVTEKYIEKNLGDRPLPEKCYKKVIKSETKNTLDRL
jgi:transcription elongation factor Elf1